MLYCNRRMLGVGYQFPSCSRLSAQSLKYLHVIGAGTDDARRRAFHQRGNECKRLAQGGWRVEDSRIGCYANEARQYEDRESERLRPSRQASDPGRILGVLNGGILNVSIYQHIDIWEQHLELPASKPGLVIPRIKRPGPIEVDSGGDMNATHSHQPEWQRL